MDWLSKCPFYAPTIIKPIPQSRKSNADNIRPFRKRMAFAIVDYHSVSARVIALLFHGRPPAIVGSIIAVVVYAVYRESVSISMRKRPISKVFVFLPLFTYAYASASITAVIGAMRI